MGGKGMENNFLGFIASPAPSLPFLRLYSLVKHVHKGLNIPSHLLLCTKGQAKNQVWLKCINYCNFKLGDNDGIGRAEM